MKEELHIFYFTKYRDVDEFTKELSGYIEDLLSLQKQELLEKLNEWRYKDHNPEEDCQCQKCQYYREIVAMEE